MAVDIAVVEMFLVVEGEDSICTRLNLSLMFSLKHMVYDALSHKISVRRHISLPVCPMKDFEYWSHMSKTTDRN